MDDETVATPTGSLFPSRFSMRATPDEGRFLPGTLVAGRYRVIGLLGRGGMGEVYRATDLTLGQSVALKFLPESAAANEHLLERFHNEVRVARQVSHANVCRVYDVGEADGHPFLSMEYVDGEDLSTLLARIGRLPADKALEITRKLCAGLAAAHERGIIHRDLKPQNVMLNRRGEVVIMDFGLAAVADELRGAEARNGTPAYMAPEQLRGDSVTLKSDLYSLGLIAFELFTGKRPFEAASVAELIATEEKGKPPSLSTLVSDVDPAVEKAILRCLQPDPSQRPPSALAVAASLPGGDPLAAALAAGETPSPELVAASGEAEGFARRYAVPSLVFVLLVVLAYPFLVRHTALLAMAPMPFPPDVLAQKARDIAAAIAAPGKATDWKSWLWTNGDMIEYLRKRPGRKDWKQLFAAESPVEFSYRQSPEYLKAPPDGNVTEDRPPQTLPGMFSITLDSRGRLRGFEAVAPREDNREAAKPFDPAAVFRAAGLDLARLHEVEPHYVPSQAFDWRRAWTGSYPGLGSDVPLTIEVAAWRGAATSVYFRWPWTKPLKISGESYSLSRAFAFVLFITLQFTIILFARRNLRLGRGDRQGATRLAAAVFAVWAVYRLAAAHMIPSFNLVGYLTVDLGLGLLIAGLLWLIYIAIEPAVRARWPHSLITWNRLLAGKLRDPRVGSHILIGTVIGMALPCVFFSATYWKLTGGGAPDETGLSLLEGVRPLIERFSGTLFNAIQTGFVIFFLLCGLRALLRRDWLAAFAAAAILTVNNVQNSGNLWVDTPLAFLVLAGLGLVLLRMGLVPAIIGVFIGNLAMSIPAADDPSSWYTPVIVLYLIVIASVAIYGFVRSQARAPGRAA